MKTSIVSKNNPENRRLAHPDARRPSPVERRKRVQFDFAGSSAILTVIPLLLLAWALALRWASGPFWLGHNSDPAYPYLFSSLSLSQGLTVWHTDHPGAIEFRTTNHLQEIPTVFYYRASDPTFALHFGNTWAGGQFSEPLNKARPEFLHFNRWTRSYDRGFSEKLDSIEDLLGESDYFYIQGAAGVALEEFETRSSPSNYAIQRIFTGSVEQILEVSLTKPDDQDVTSEKPVHP